MATGETADKRRPVKVESVSVTGPLGRQTATSTVEKQTKSFDGCFPRQKQRGVSKVGPAMPSSVELRLFVDKSGRVVAATLEQPLDRYPDVTHCLMRKASSLRFKAATSHSTVRFRVRSGRPEYGILGLLRGSGAAGGVSNIFGGSSGGVGSATGGLGLRGSGGIPVAKAGLLGGRPPTGRVRSGTITVRGSLTRDQVRRGVGRQMSALRRCYQRRLVARPTLAGGMTVTFVIGTRGTVDRVNVGSTLGDPDANQCVMAVFRRLTFPSPPGGGVVTVTYPLTFSVAP